MEYKTLGRTGLRVSRIGLGTAEIGFAYGIGPRSLPTEREAIEFLRGAVDLGITYFDAAYFYGVAEERIGKSGIAKMKDVVITTKCGQFLEQGEDPSGAELEQRLRVQVESSLRNLGVESVPILMLHGGSAEQIARGELISILRKFQIEGMAQFLGISTRGEEAPLMAIKAGVFDVIQVAYSILDQRMTAEIMPLAFSKGIGIVNRSVFLKGALTSSRNKLPKYGFMQLAENTEKVNQWAKLHNISLEELSLKFALVEDTISTSLVGTNKTYHLRQAIHWSELRHFSSCMIGALREFAISDPNQIDPAKWPKLS